MFDKNQMTILISNRKPEAEENERTKAHIRRERLSRFFLFCDGCLVVISAIMFFGAS